MAGDQIKSLALKWFFFATGGYPCYAGFFNVFMKQLGLSSQQIGLTNLFGVQSAFVPFLLYVADKYRLRYLTVWMVTIIAVVTCLLVVLPIVVSLPSCFAMNTTLNYSVNVTNFPQIKSDVPRWSNLFIVVTISRSIMTIIECLIFALGSLATFTYLGNDRAKYGNYFTWRHVGACTLVVTAALIAWKVKIKLCGVEDYSYFASFILAALLYMLSMISLPFFEFKYVTNRTINWMEIKGVVFNCHYIYIYFIASYIGACFAFQMFWEFWFLDELQASPLVMGAVSLVRRPILAVFSFTSYYVIKEIGELNTLSICFLLYVVSFLALSFIRVYWYVLVIDILPSAAYGLGRSALLVYFSKAGSKASSGVILGLESTFFSFGLECGAAVFGILFHAMGTQKTLLAYAGITAIMLTIFLCYLKFSDVDEYDKIPVDDTDDCNNN